MDAVDGEAELPLQPPPPAATGVLAADQCVGPSQKLRATPLLIDSSASQKLPLNPASRAWSGSVARWLPGTDAACSGVPLIHVARAHRHTGPTSSSSGSSLVPPCPSTTIDCTEWMRNPMRSATLARSAPSTERAASSASPSVQMVTMRT